MQTATKSTAELLHYGPWQIPYKVLRCLCPDGKRRTARLTSHADTYFSIPASVSYRGKTVSGFVTNVRDGEDDLQFIPIDGRKNSDAFNS